MSQTTSISPPAAELPNRFDFAAAQERWYAYWEQRGYFHSEPHPKREPFSIVIPPPNVTGALHLGHALNNTLQDALVRMKRMQGFNTLWVPGTDHAGIATQAVVERRLLLEEKKSRHELGREKLVARIWQWKEQYEARILGQLKRLGASCDWQRTRFTLDSVCARAVRHTFFELFRRGLIYRGYRLVNWDTYLQTAVSDDEVYHETVQGHFWHFRYPVIDPRPGEPDSVTIATTRPETMLGDTAVAVHPDPAGALARAEAEIEERLAKAPAKDRAAIERELDQVRQRRQTLLPQLEKLRDMALAGKLLLLPLVDREIPLVADEWARPELGTGCVKITPAHDPNDYEVGLRQRLPMLNILNGDGTLNAQAGPYQGLTIAKARLKVVADLEAAGLVEKVEDREIDLAHSDRSKTPIEPFLAEQWFVRMGEAREGEPGLAQSAMNAVLDNRVKIFPSRYAKGYLDWLAEKRDWPVSRQLWWGHRIPIWYARCPERVLKRAFGERADVTWSPAGKGEEWLVCALDDLPENALQAAAAAEGVSLTEPLRQESDVLDTWFSSALWPHSTLGWPERTAELDYFYPTSVLITSRDIITLWVARMVLTGLFNMREIPFREVFIHPKILDGYGETMSKSKGNGVDPLDVIDKFGADALRFGLAHLCTETQDVRMPVQFECPHCQHLLDQTKKNRELPRVACPKCQGEFSTQWAALPQDQALPRGAVVSERFELARNFGNKLWNAARFALMNLGGYRPGPLAASELTLEDRWLLSRLATVTRLVTDAFEHYRYADAARELYNFSWDEFCSFYVEMAKGRLQDEARRNVAQRVLAYALDTLLRLLHPLMPFLTEEVWQLLNQAAPERGLATVGPASPSIMVAPWPRSEPAWENPTIEAQFARFQAVLGALREIRSRQNIGMKSGISFFVACSEETAQLLRPMQPYFTSMANAQGVAWGAGFELPQPGATLAAGEAEVTVDLRGLIDVGAEVARIEKEIQRITGALRGKEAKLGSESFVSKAPPDVVAREREGLAQLQEQLASATTALAALKK